MVTHRHLFSLQTVGRDIIKAFDEIKGIADILAIMRQNLEESFEKIMVAAVKIAEDTNIAVNKPRVAKQSVYEQEQRMKMSLV